MEHRTTSCKSMPNTTYHPWRIPPLHHLDATGFSSQPNALRKTHHPHHRHHVHDGHHDNDHHHRQDNTNTWKSKYKLNVRNGLQWRKRKDQSAIYKCSFDLEANILNINPEKEHSEVAKIDKLAQLAAIACNTLESHASNSHQIIQNSGELFLLADAAKSTTINKKRRSPRNTRFNAKAASIFLPSFYFNSGRGQYKHNDHSFDSSSWLSRMFLFRASTEDNKMKYGVEDRAEAIPYNNNNNNNNNNNDNNNNDNNSNINIPSASSSNSGANRIKNSINNPWRGLEKPYDAMIISQKRKHMMETRIERCACAILKFIEFEHTIAERFIREALGNNPDTSKALRLLLSQQKIKRLGRGGRREPFIYKVASNS